MYAWGHRTRLGHGKLEDDGAWLQHVILSVCQFSMYRTLSFVHSDLHIKLIVHWTLVTYMVYNY